MTINELSVSEFNVRKMTTVEKESEEFKNLVQSIKSSGVIEPIIVRKSTNKIVVGQRRFEACKMLDMDEIQCIVKELTDEECLRYSLIENKQRKDVDPIDFAEGLKKMIDLTVERVTCSQNEAIKNHISPTVGLTRASVFNYLSLLNLSPEVKDKIQEGVLGVKIGSQLSTLPEDKQKEMVDIIQEEHLPNDVIEDVIREVKENPEREIEEVVEEVFPTNFVVFEIRTPDKNKMNFKFPLNKWTIFYKRAKALNKTPTTLIMEIIEKWIGEDLGGS